ncbi:MAG: DMT family transporter [Clostridia bacterium]|nr:DMT family transporter [Clostridia bacterium]
MQKKKQLIGTLFLLAAAIVWGASFVFQNEGASLVHPIAFNGIRSIVGALSLLPVIAVLTLISKKNRTYQKPTAKQKKDLWLGGTCCGLVVCIAATLQTIGIEQGAGEAGFITTIYIVFVPILGIFLRQKIPHKAWIAVMMCVGGLYLLCGSFAFNINQIYLLMCAFFFAIHILVIDYFAPKVDGVKLSCIQFMVAGILDCIIMVFVEIPTWQSIVDCFWPNIAYAGMASCAIGYTCQIIGQKYVAATVGSLLMSLESVFSVFFQWLLQGELLAPKQIAGCVIIFAAVVLVQLPTKSNNKQKVMQ